MQRRDLIPLKHPPHLKALNLLKAHCANWSLSEKQLTAHFLFNLFVDMVMSYDLVRPATADGDLLVVRELRKLSSLSKRGEKMAPRVSEEELKWLDWPDFVQVRLPMMQGQAVAVATLGIGEIIDESWPGGPTGGNRSRCYSF